MTHPFSILVTSSPTATPAQTEEQWRPGDPLFRRVTGFRDHFFNFRDESNGDSCSCPDAASWPEPRHADDLDRIDLLERARRGDDPDFLADADRLTAAAQPEGAS